MNSWKTTHSLITETIIEEGPQSINENKFAASNSKLTSLRRKSHFEQTNSKIKESTRTDMRKSAAESVNSA